MVSKKTQKIFNRLHTDFLENEKLGSETSLHCALGLILM